jgi:hypothetical protein
MKDAYQSQYMDPEFKHVTEAWDTFQDRVRPDITDWIGFEPREKA